METNKYLFLILKELKKINPEDRETLKKIKEKFEEFLKNEKDIN